jgi:signal transduction histidine kinase
MNETSRAGKFSGADKLDLFAGGTEVRELMRTCDWKSTPLGPPDQWPSGLRAIVRAMLNSRFAMWMAWGPELTFLCNDAYLPTVGIKRDWVIGSRSDKVWEEIWPDIGPRIAHVLATGEATWDEELLLYLQRRGYLEETYHTFSYSPLADDNAQTAGMLCVVAEVTEKVIGERQLATLRDLGTTLAVASTRREVMTALEKGLATHPRDIPFAFAYLSEKDPRIASLAAIHRLDRDAPGVASEILLGGSGDRWSLATATEPGLVTVEPETVSGLSLDHWLVAPQRALVAPINSAEDAAPVGYLVAGLNPHRAFDAAYRGFIELLTAQLAAAVARADEYEKARERAEALAELDRAKTAFFSNVSHEFRTPLTLMLGPLEDALAEAGNSGIARERLDVAHRNALRLLRLVNSLLDFSRIEAGRVQVSFRPTDLAALTAELASSFRSATDRAGLRLTVDTSTLSQAVYVDRDMWEKIVLNLLSNAFKFTFEGEIVVTLREQEGAVRLTVRDTGTGIGADELPKLFDRFHRVEGAQGRSFEGSGIGLALVRELVKQHGGEISVESTLGKGSAFIVTLPLGTAHLPADRIDAAAAHSTAARAQSFVEEALRWMPGENASSQLLDTMASPNLAFAGEAVGNGGRASRVLLADDNADLRGYITRLLTQNGYEVVAVADGEAALQQARASRPDILITDVMMPRMDGFGLLRAVRDNPALRDLPIVMLSARAGEEAKVEGLEAGVDDYLTKPFSARELLARVSANIAMSRVRREAKEAVDASEALAREQAERVQLALDAGAIVGVWVWDVRRDRFIADDRFARSFGIDAELCRTGLPLEQVMASIHEDDRLRVAATISEGLERGGPYRCEYRVRHADGTYRWIEANGRIDLDAHGRAIRFPGVLIDVDHRHRIESALRQLNEQLEERIAKAIAEREQAEEALRQAQKMEAVGQLTGGIAHDFNNLLTIITGNVDIARRSLTSGETVRASRAMDHAQKGAERAAALTQRLLAFSRRQPLAPKPINVDRLVGGMADLLNRSLGETVKLEIVSTPGLWRVEVDPNQLESAILNLAVNARDAMPRGGQLTIETANARLDEKYSAAHAEVAPGNYVVIAVTDTGHGMSKETMARVFDPFFTTKEVGKGTGLGLSMVYGFVKQSGGHVKIYSEPDDGTTIKIYLPRLLSGEEDAHDQVRWEVDKTSRGQSILVVEDDDDVRTYTVEILRELGYRVLEAHDGPAALRWLKQADQKVDLLFTDVVMPEMSGRELADRARELRGDLKVLYTSGYTRNAIVHGGRLDAGVEMIPKPFTYQALAEKIADVLDTGGTGRILVVESDATLRMFTTDALESVGFSVEEAATAAEALGRTRAANGGYDAVFLNATLPSNAGVSLVSELRALHADLPILIAAELETDQQLQRFANDRCIAVVGKPYNASKLQTALSVLGVRRRR